MEMTRDEAIEFFFRYGNVGRTREDLERTDPTPGQLSEAFRHAILVGQWVLVAEAAMRALATK